MQSYANSFWGDVILDNFNNVSKDEDNILDQMYKKTNIFSAFCYKDLNSKSDLIKCIFREVQLSKRMSS